MNVKFYVPSKDNKGILLTESVRNSSLHSVATTLARKFGGATSTNGIGMFLSNTGDIIEEHVQILTSNVKRISLKDKREIRTLAQEVKKNLRQESIMIEFNDKAEFI